MKIYRGRREEGFCWVTVDGQPLAERRDLVNHSPTGFEWGYGGSGPAQLALAILADAVGDELALEWYQHFKSVVIASLPYAWWTLNEAAVVIYLEQIQAAVAFNDVAGSAPLREDPPAENLTPRRGGAQR